MELTRADNNKLRRDLSRDAISLALAGEWERAAAVNAEILEMFKGDADAMNRLGKALMELGRYSEAKEVLDQVVQAAPYNNIAKKNLARLAQLETAPAPSKQGRKSGGVTQLFIEESGKSGTTVLYKPASGAVIASVAPGDPVILVVDKNVINVYVREEEYLGRIEPKLASRLIRLMNGGNRYDAAIIGVNDLGVSIIIREVYRHPSLRKDCSFPSKSKEAHRVYLGDSFLRYIEETDLDEDEEDEVAVVKDDGDSDWDE